MLKSGSRAAQWAVLSLSLVAAACGAAAPPTGATASASQDLSQAPGGGRTVVVFKSDTLPADAAARVTKAGGTVVRSLPQAGVVIASGNVAAALARDASVLAAGPEHLYSAPQVTVSDADPDAYAGLAPQDNLWLYQWDQRRIGVPTAWSRVPLEAQGAVMVGVLDTGVMDNHPDLAGQVALTLATNYCQETGGPANSPSYPIYSKLIDFDAHPTWSPSDGCAAVAPTYEAHGTHVSGTIAAKSAGGRVVGVGPGLRIAAYKVFDRYRYTNASGKVVDAVGAFDGPVFSAILDAASRGVRVINMSLGSGLDRSNRDDNASWLAWDRVVKAATRAGTLVVASAGNEEANSNGTVAHLPSDLPLALSVSATGSSNLTRDTQGLFQAAPGSDVLAFYSNVGSAVDLAAPGGDCGPGYPATCVAQYLILSSTVSATGTPNYSFYAGTSMASPHVAAVAALVAALHPEMTPAQLKSRLTSTGEPIGDRQEFGHGLLDAAAAVY